MDRVSVSDRVLIQTGRWLRAGARTAWAARWMLLLAAALATLGLRGAASCGHDFDFHLDSWMDAARAWRQGVWMPGWAQGPAWQAGESRFVFYPPLTWIAGALLGSLFGAGVGGWTLSSWVFVFAALLASGLATRRLAGEWLPRETAQLAGLLAILAPYALFTAFERSALAELAAAPWIPLAVLFSTRVGSQTAGTGQGTGSVSNRSTRMLALVIAGCWLTNAPTGVMLCYMLAGVALIAAWSERAWWPVIRAAVAVIVGLGLAAFYLVPAALEQRWVNIDAAKGAGMRVEDSWLFARHIDAALAFHDAVLRRASIVFALTAAISLAGILVVARAGGLQRSARARWLPLLLLLPMVCILQFPASAVVWHLLPKAEFLQFPWRLTLLLTPGCAIFAAQALPLLHRKLRVSLIVAAVLLSGFACFFVFHQPCDEEDNIAAQLAQSQHEGFPPTDEYAPIGADSALLAAGLPAGCLVANPQTPLGAVDDDGQRRWTPEASSCIATASASELSSSRISLFLLAPRDGYLILRLRRFPAWSLFVNGRPEDAAIVREDGLYAVPVSAGFSRIDARWTTTQETICGRWISLAALVLWLFLWRMSWRRQPCGRGHGLH